MTYDLDTYVKNATRTESVVDEITTDPLLLAGAMTIFIAAGNILDQIKKHAFYGKEYDRDKLITEFMVIISALDQIKPSIDGTSTEEHTIDVNTRVFHAIVGTATESAELLEALTVAWMDGNMDNVNILEEFGDLNWYEAIAIDELKGNFANVLDTNIEKLRARFPEKFTSENAINRDLNTEREILENVELGKKG